jgi:hypothetical protein
VRSRSCACGCGEMIEGPRQKRYVDDSHRQRAGRRRRRWFGGPDPDGNEAVPEPADEPSEPPPTRDPFDEHDSMWRSWPR